MKATKKKNNTKKYKSGGFLKGLADTGLLIGDTSLSAIGGQDIIKDKAYNYSGMAKASRVTGAAAKAAAPIVAGALLGPAGSMAVSGLQQVPGGLVPKDEQTELGQYSDQIAGMAGSLTGQLMGGGMNTPKPATAETGGTFKKGGKLELIDFKGPLHTEGGIKLMERGGSNIEVEGGEKMIGDTILSNNKDIKWNNKLIAWANKNGLPIGKEANGKTQAEYAKYVDNKRLKTNDIFSRNTAEIMNQPGKLGLATLQKASDELGKMFNPDAEGYDSNNEQLGKQLLSKGKYDLGGRLNPSKVNRLDDEHNPYLYLQKPLQFANDFKKGGNITTPPPDGQSVPMDKDRPLTVVNNVEPGGGRPGDTNDMPINYNSVKAPSKLSGLNPNDLLSAHYNITGKLMQDVLNKGNAAAEKAKQYYYNNISTNPLEANKQAQNIVNWESTIEDMPHSSHYYEYPAVQALRKQYQEEKIKGYRNGGEPDITSDYYHTNDKGIIDAGPYAGLSVDEAREMNKSQRSDAAKAKKESQAKYVADYTRASMNKAGETIKDVAKGVASFTPMGPVIGAVDAYDAISKGNYGEGLLTASMEALPYGLGKIADVAKPLVKKAAQYAKPAIEEGADKLKKLYYNKAPWTFKANPDNYYRAGSKEMLQDADEFGSIRVKQQESLADKAIAEGRTPTLLEKLSAPHRAGDIPYFSKGKPLSSKYDEMYGTSGSNYGDYIIETSSKDMKAIGPKGKPLKGDKELIGDDIPSGYNATPTKQLSTDNTKLLKPDWFYGYKPYIKEGSESIKKVSKSKSKVEEVSNTYRDIDSKLRVSKSGISYNPKQIDKNLLQKAESEGLAPYKVGTSYRSVIGGDAEGLKPTWRPPDLVRTKAELDVKPAHYQSLEDYTPEELSSLRQQFIDAGYKPDFKYGGTRKFDGNGTIPYADVIKDTKKYKELKQNEPIPSGYEPITVTDGRKDYKYYRLKNSMISNPAMEQAFTWARAEEKAGRLKRGDTFNWAGVGDIAYEYDTNPQYVAQTDRIDPIAPLKAKASAGVSMNNSFLPTNGMKPVDAPPTIADVREPVEEDYQLEKVNEPTKKNPYNLMGTAAALAGIGVSAAVNLPRVNPNLDGGDIFSPAYKDFDPKRYNEIKANLAYASAQNSGSSGNYLSNMLATQARVGSDASAEYNGILNANTDIRNRAGEINFNNRVGTGRFNTHQKNMADSETRQNRADFASDAINGLNYAVNDINEQGKERANIAMMNQMYPNNQIKSESHWFKPTDYNISEKNPYGDKQSTTNVDNSTLENGIIMNNTPPWLDTTPNVDPFLNNYYDGVNKTLIAKCGGKIKRNMKLGGTLKSKK